MDNQQDNPQRQVRHRKPKLQPQPEADHLWLGRERLANSLLRAHDDMLLESEKLTEFDKRAIAGLTYKPEWSSYEKLLNGLIFRSYRQILVDEDIKGAKKLIFFATALKNIPKSFRNENNMDSGKDEVQIKDPGDIGIEI